MTRQSWCGRAEQTNHNKPRLARIGSRPDSENSKSALDRRLDQALEQTFPASDPVSVICTACPPELFNAEQ
jgi:hypothetical protein